MRIEFRQSGFYSSIRHFFHIYGIHVVALYFLQDEVQFAPPVVVAVEFLPAVDNLHHDQSRKYAEDNTHQCCQCCV